MAAEAPLLIVVEFEPAETSFLAVGATLRLHAALMDADTKQPVDPDTLTLSVKPPFTTPTVYTYGSGSFIVKNEVGNYQADPALSVAGQWRFQYLATLNSISVASNTVVMQAVSSGWW